jgi:hypothetical protein
VPHESTIVHLQQVVVDQAHELTQQRQLLHNISEFTRTRFTGDTDEDNATRDILATALTGVGAAGVASPNRLSTRLLAEISGLPRSYLRKACVRALRAMLSFHCALTNLPCTAHQATATATFIFSWHLPAYSPCMMLLMRTCSARRRKHGGDMEASGYRRARRKDAVQDDAVPFASAFLHRISRVDNNRKGSHRVLTLLPTGDYAVEFHENREFDCKATKNATLSASCLSCSTTCVWPPTTERAALTRRAPWSASSSTVRFWTRCEWWYRSGHAGACLTAPAAGDSDATCVFCRRFVPRVCVAG